MARYVTHIRTDRPADEVFAYMADLRHFAEWDPGVKQVVQVEGDGGGLGTVFDVTVAAGPRDTTLRYRTTEHRAPESLIVVAQSSLLVSTDQVTVRSVDGGSVVTYDAILRLRGLAVVAAPLLMLAFQRIGDRASVGLRRVLDGTEVVAA